jgi:hypothetical protein
VLERHGATTARIRLFLLVHRPSSAARTPSTPSTRATASFSRAPPAEDVELQYNDLRTNCNDVVAPLFSIRDDAARMRRLQTLLMRVSSVSHVPSGVRAAAHATDIETAVQALVRGAQFHERQREASRKAVAAAAEGGAGAG